MKARGSSTASWRSRGQLLTAMIVLAWMGALNSPADDRQVTPPKTASLSSIIIDSAADPEVICKQIGEHVQYAPHATPDDKGRAPEQTVQLGHGNCEDFASTVRAVCAAKDIPTKIYVVTSRINQRSHAVTISDEGGNMWMSSNGSYSAVLSLSDAKDHICRIMGWWYDDTTIEEKLM
jgi:Transglutaminase-like superfamily